ncbi:MAG: hypothetical protein VR64_06845 [Desulfatitalea sp. BRH_c12]|nr:MAG: hypothetical protein VR64_06845 [Desulfatitalea sp. BRH_c12]
MFETQFTSDGVTFWVLVQPRASKKEIVGLHQDALKIKLTAPPVEGAANKQCIEVLADALERPKTTLTIIAGLTNRRKQVLVQARHGTMAAAEKEAVRQRLEYMAHPKK